MFPSGYFAKGFFPGGYFPPSDSGVLPGLLFAVLVGSGRLDATPSALAFAMAGLSGTGHLSGTLTPPIVPTPPMGGKYTGSRAELEPFDIERDDEETFAAYWVSRLKNL